MLTFVHADSQIVCLIPEPLTVKFFFNLSEDIQWCLVEIVTGFGPLKHIVTVRMVTYYIHFIHRFNEIGNSVWNIFQFALGIMA